MTRIGVIGYGYWGPNLVRNFNSTPRATVVRVADRDAGRRESVRTLYPQIDVVEDGAAVIGAADVDAVLIATPAHTHHALARQALEAGKHVLVEKPMATTSAQCQELVDLARSRGLVLQVDHTFIYTPAVQRIREAVASGELGEIYYVDSVRINLGIFQRDVNVVWDLAPHDLAIFDFCFGRAVTSVTATGMCYAKSPMESMAYLSLEYEGGMMGHIHVNWLSPVKMRQMIIGGSRRMLVFNDLEPSEKIRIYDRGAEVDLSTREGVHQMRVDYRSGDIWVPALPAREALAIEAQHFVECIESGSAPRTGGEAGLAVVRVLEAAQQSLARGGVRVTL